MGYLFYGRILSGEFDIGDRVPDIKQEESALKSKQEIEVKAEVLAGKLAQDELEKIEEGWTEDQIYCYSII